MANPAPASRLRRAGTRGSAIKAAAASPDDHEAAAIASRLSSSSPIQHDPATAPLCPRKRAQGKEHNAAVIRGARRRCNIILAMPKTQTPYHPANLNETLRLVKDDRRLWPLATCGIKNDGPEISV